MDLYREIENVKLELVKITELLKSQKATSEKLKMYDIADLIQILNVSRRTIATYTKNGTLPHTKVGNKIWVTEDQLNLFLDKNTISSAPDLKIRKGGNYDSNK
jgi:excisionase family DNA binding protein